MTHLLGVFSLAGFSSSRVFGDTSVWLDKAEVHAFFSNQSCCTSKIIFKRSTMKTQSLKQKVRQNFKTKLPILILFVFLLPLHSCAQKSKTKESNYSNVDYSKKSNIIKNPEKLIGDERAIFYHPFFLKLTSKEVENLDPFIVKEEFAKIGITVDNKERFQKAYSFLDATLVPHKISCQQWESFKDLAPKSKN